MKTIAAYLFILFFYSNNFWSQSQIAFRQLSVKNGLSQNSVIDIAQDSTGFLWFATQDGLNKYDGKTFEKFDLVFEDITNHSYNQLGKVYIDKQKTIWAITIDRRLMR